MGDAKTLLTLPPELILMVLLCLDARSLMCAAGACSGLLQMLAPVEEALRRRAAVSGRVCPTGLPRGVPSWAAYLMQLEKLALRLSDADWAVRHFMEAKADNNTTEAERWAASMRHVSMASQPKSVASENIRLLVSAMNNKELVRFAQRGMNEGTFEEILAQRATDICAFCQDDVTVGDVTIILPCCGKRPHKECFVKWSSRSGRCMYCSTRGTTRRGFQTHASFTRWLIDEIK